MTDLAKKMEALLFVAGEAVSRKDLAAALSCGEAEIGEVLDELANCLEGHGLTILEVGGLVQLTCSREVGAFIQGLLQGESEELSAAAAETLALVAYRGPISRPEIDAIRGVDSRRMLRQLTARGLVRWRRESGVVRRYVVTEDFLRSLGLRRVEELPDYEILSQAEKIEQLLS